MGMSVGSEDDDEMIGTINTTPLVDVMLVLLIIFLITIPVVTYSSSETTRRKNTPYATTPENIQLSVNKKGDIFWNENYVPNKEILLAKLQAVAQKDRSRRYIFEEISLPILKR